MQDGDLRQVSADISQNHRATFASGQHPLDLQQEAEFLAPLGLCVAVVDSPSAEFVFGSHGITITDTGNGRNSWLPLAPDIAISFWEEPSSFVVVRANDQFVEAHNQAALAMSDRIGGRSERTVVDLLATLS